MWGNTAARDVRKDLFSVRMRGRWRRWQAVKKRGKKQPSPQGVGGGVRDGGASQVFPSAQTLIWWHQRAAVSSPSRTICVLPAVSLSRPRQPSLTWAGRPSSHVCAAVFCWRCPGFISVSTLILIFKDLFHVFGLMQHSSSFQKKNKIKKKRQLGDFLLCDAQQSLALCCCCCFFCLNSSEVLQWRHFISTGVSPLTPSVSFDMLVK